jgi:hypothetical protein
MQIVQTIKPPRAGGLCAQAWEAFEAHYVATKTPCTSKDLQNIAQGLNLNITNLRIELSRYNRFMRQLHE